MLLILATNNAHKTGEFAQILGPDWPLADLSALPPYPAPEEDGESFADNAAIKALAASRLAPPGALAIADDSGLCVDALDGAPGVISARFSGPSATDSDNCALLIQRLSALPLQPPYPARFICCIALARDAQLLGTFGGEVEGHIHLTPSGTGGFGYDPLFVPLGHTRTFAEMTGAEKAQLSHRARAIARLVVEGLSPLAP